VANNGDQDPLSATGAGLKPGEYPLGSAQSRAAARTLLERRRVGRRRIEIISSIPRPGGAEGEICIGDRIERPDGTLFRISSIPPGMTIEEAERIVSQPDWKHGSQP
jgi:hypothetical protein